ncbi:MAG: DNA helicase Rep [Kistimonas sp.]|nr:DNA helicase Rep [Kistimonas sp.]
MSQLNARQKEAVHYISGPLLVLAGAGSGKTSVITRKIAYLLEECGLKARNVVAVTFTNKAAREMKERVSQLITGTNTRGLTVSTFHNLGMKIIGKECGHLGLRAGFSIFDQQDAGALLASLMHQQTDPKDDKCRFVQECISNWKNNLVYPEQAESTAADEEEQWAAQVYAHYTRALRAFNAVDFDDLILLPVQLFQTRPDRLAHWQEKIHYLLVDEYQDTNSSQYLLVRQLVGDRGMLTVVGDDDQSIYAWRGARAENLELLRQDYPSLKLVKLEQNYRSTSRILKAANQLIANNPHFFEKKLWSDLGVGEEIRVIRCSSEDGEAERVATEILTHRLRYDTRWQDYAILYRSNFQSRLLEMKLQEHQIPYQINGGTSFFSRTEVKDVMAYLRLLVNPDDDNAFLRIINVPRREIGTATLEKLSAFAGEHSISLYQACQYRAALEERLDRRYVAKLTQFVEWMDTLARQGDSDPMAAVESLVRESDYESWLHQQASSSAVAERRMNNILFLVNAIRKSMEKDDDNGSLKDAVARLILRDMMERQEEENDQNQVQLLTLHASKGLEYPQVFMIGVEEELLPHRNSVETGDVDEERRLAYVGITRARKRLVITLAAQRRQYGETVETSPSRFIDELPQEDLIYEGWEQRSTPEQRHARGQEALDDILKELG